MLVGTTFAWFTDTASVSVNTIRSGKLDVQLVDADGNELTEALKWVSADADATEILWEPGCTYKLQSFYVKNNGNLALKYKVVISGVNGDAKLLDVLTFTYQVGEDTFTADSEFQLAAGVTSGEFVITAHMDETAGTEYMNLSVEGITITVYATQDVAESDSNGNDYDKNATYPEVAYVKPATQEELNEALTNPKNAKGEPTNEVVVELNEGNYTLPSLENKTVSISGTKDTVIDMKGTVNKASTASFDGVTVEFAQDTYKGFQHTGKLVYKDCTIKGLQFLYADEVEFINCTFEQDTDDAYHLWTYAAKNVTFTDCHFNSTAMSKAVLCYVEEAGKTYTRTFNNCTFTATGDAEKSAIMINPTAYGVNTYIININNCTATGYGENGISGQTIVGVKETVRDNITINIDGVTVYTH